MTLCVSCQNTCEFILDMQSKLPVWFDNKNEIQFHLPSELLGLREGKKLFIQRINVYVPVHHLFKGQTGCKGHTAAFQQDISRVINVLPNLPNNVQFVQVIKMFKDEHGDIGEKSFVIRKKKVLDALFWIQKYNRHYSDVIVEATRLNWIEKMKQSFQKQKKSEYTSRMLSKQMDIVMLTSSRALLSTEFRKKMMDLPHLK